MRRVSVIRNSVCPFTHTSLKTKSMQSLTLSTRGVCNMLSLVIPLYRSEANLPRLFRELISLAAKTSVPLEVVFVNDGSPDRCADIVARSAPQLPFPCQLVEFSRNFGSFSALVAALAQ